MRSSDSQIVEMVCDDIHKSFGGREYSDIQKKVLTDLIRIYGHQNFKRVAKRLVEEGTSKPYPVHFKTQLQNLPADMKPISHEAHEVALCEFCMGTGKVFFKKEFVEHAGAFVVAHCKCPIGIHDNAHDSSLPLIDNRHKQFLMKFPIELFNPGSFQKRQGRVDWWNEIQNNSRNYWAKKNEAG